MRSLQSIPCRLKMYRCIFKHTICTEFAIPFFLASAIINIFYIFASLKMSFPNIRCFGEIYRAKFLAITEYLIADIFQLWRNFNRNQTRITKCVFSHRVQVLRKFYFLQFCAVFKSVPKNLCNCIREGNFCKVSICTSHIFNCSHGIISTIRIFKFRRKRYSSSRNFTRTVTTRLQPYLCSLLVGYCNKPVKFIIFCRVRRCTARIRTART